MKRTAFATLVLLAVSQSMTTLDVLAGGRGQGGSGGSHGGASHGNLSHGSLSQGGLAGGQSRSQGGMQSSGTQFQKQVGNNPAGSHVKLPAGTVQSKGITRENPLPGNFPKFPLNTHVNVNPKTPIIAAPGKPIDPGLGNGNPFKKPIDLGLGNGKPPVIDPGIGNGQGIKKPIDLGLGNGQGPVSPILGGGKFKHPIVPVNPGNHPPKIPICPPYCFPSHPVHCHPCPNYFFNWCWFPGFGSCYGYCGGVTLPVVTTQTVVVELPVTEVVSMKSVPQIVPGTVVEATLLNAGSDAGRVLMQYGSVALQAEVQNWADDKVTFVVPAVALKEAVAVKLMFLRADGQVAQELDCELVAATVEQQ
ncbi:MAG: hypothetical protein ACKV0T_15095 [Planctomycetales bacterium]